MTVSNSARRLVDTLYFDNNATTFMDPRVANRIHERLGLGLANPSSQHRAGRTALHLLEDAKTELIKSLDAPATGMETAQVFLTSGGTEANNLAIFGLRSDSLPRPVLVSSIEHPSVLEAAAQLPQPPRFLSVDSNGRLLLDDLQQQLVDVAAPAVVSVMLGNNETGIVQDLKAICDIAHRFGAVVHSDITQAIGKIPFSMLESGVDAVSFTAHKLHGPVGIGALVVRPGLKVSPQMFGGGQQLEVRPGTENVLLADAFAFAVRLSLEALAAGDYDKVAELRQRFEHRLAQELGNIDVVAAAGPRLPHTSNVGFRGIDRQALLIALDLCGIACSTGSACASGSGRPSHVLQAMKLEPAMIAGSLRFSFSRFTTSEEVENGLEKLIRTVRKLRA